MPCNTMPNLFKSILVAVQSSRTQRVGQINARSTEIRRDLTSECDQPLVVGLRIDFTDTVSVIKTKWQLTIL